MNSSQKVWRPRARKNDLLIETLPEETLVYDTNRHRAHCLNRQAAFVWERCDGEQTISNLAQSFALEFGGEANPEIVEIALSRLNRAHLLAGQSLPVKKGYSRREALRKLKNAAIPVVISIISPTAAQAATLVTVADCFFNPGTSAGLCCTNARICRQFGSVGLCIGPAC